MGVRGPLYVFLALTAAGCGAEVVGLTGGDGRAERRGGKEPGAANGGPGEAATTTSARATPADAAVLEATPLVGRLGDAVAAEYPDRDVVISMEVSPRLPGARTPVALRFRFELTYRGGEWLPAPAGFTANVYDYQWRRPPFQSNIRVRGEAEPRGLAWTAAGGLKGRLAWRFEKPFRELVGRSARRYVPGSAWKLVPEEGEVEVELPLNPVARKPRATGLPPWWQPTVFGFNYYGNFTYRAGGKTFTGEAELNVKPRPIPGRFVPWTAIKVSKAPGGVALKATLPRRRVAAEDGGFAVCELAEPVDASGFDGVRVTVETKEPRRDAAVAIGLREGTGAWYHADFACPLTRRHNTWIVPFARLVKSDFVLGRGFFDADMAFTADEVKAVAVGARNPFGVGDVKFTLKGLELVRWTGRGYGKAPADAVEVTVDAATAVRMNGVDRVPEELFGVHLVGGFPPAGGRDATKVAPERIEKLSIRHARSLLHTWLEAGGNTGVPNESALRALGLVERSPPAGGSVICYTWGNLWGRAPWMDRDRRTFLDGVREWGKKLGRQAWRPGDERNALRRVEFWNEPFMWGRHINAYDPKFRDPTQHGWIPGELGAKRYAEAFLACVEGARSANPHVLIGGMSSPSFGSDRYSVFQDYVRHFIDAAAPKIDFLTEHHYGGKPESYAAQYEVVTAYCDTRHGRRIPIVNTEANDLVDTPTYGDEGVPAPWSAHADDLIRFRYNLRDVMEMIRVCPDKARARAMHALWSGAFKKKGEACFFEIANNVAGTILDARSTDPDVPVVACAHDGKVVVLAFNDSPHPQRLTVSAKGTFRSVAEKRVAFDAATGTRIVDVPALSHPREGVFGRSVDLPPYGAVRYTLESAGRLERVRELAEHFSDVHLERIDPGETRRARVVWRPKPESAPDAAYLRVVTEGVKPGEGLARIVPAPVVPGAAGKNGGGAGAGRGGIEIELPESAPGEPVVQDVPLPPEHAARAKEIELACRNERGYETGFRVLMAAVILERRVPPGE